MSCPSYVRRFISTLPEGRVFTTRECLNLGKRANVDKALQKLVRTGNICRLARGVFTRNIGQVKFPSILEMAQIKAKAFGKELRIHGKDTAAQQGLTPEANEETTFFVDGSSSSFVYRRRRIHLKKCSKKMMTMQDSKAGLAIRALRCVGIKAFDYSFIEKIAHFWHSNNQEKEKIYRSKPWMPAWLGDFFPPYTYLGPQPNWAQTVAQSPQVNCDRAAVYIPFPVNALENQPRAS